MRGNVVLLWAVLLGGVLLIPFFVMGVRPEFRWIFLIIIGVAIYNFVRMFLGDGWITIAVAGVIFYYLVWKHQELAIFGWWFQLLVGLFVFNVLGWLYIGIRQIMFYRRAH